MTPEQQRIAIAEACGHAVTRLTIFGETVPIEYLGELPDYTNDLNAMHEAEESIIEPHDIESYAKNLYIVVETFCSSDRWVKFSRLGIDYALAHATASQRSEAFLRTICKWHD